MISSRYFFSGCMNSYLSFVFVFFFVHSIWLGFKFLKRKRTQGPPNYSKCWCICMRTDFWWVFIRIFIHCIVFLSPSFLFGLFIADRPTICSITTHRIQKLLGFELKIEQKNQCHRIKCMKIRRVIELMWPTLGSQYTKTILISIERRLNSFKQDKKHTQRFE